MRLPVILLLALILISAVQSSAEDVKPMNDPDRPTYHFQPPKNWMNDPKPFFHDGVYHIFFQYNPDWPQANLMRWGHVVSRDLVHWTQLPNALEPTPGGPDKDGCWTGCCVEKDGKYHILYTGVHPQVQCLAVSDDMLNWTKYEKNPVLSAPPAGFGDCWRDPCAWKETDAWYMVIGSEVKDVGGAALLYRSRDLVNWEYLHPLYAGSKDVDGTMYECPDFFPLGDKHVLLSSCGVTYWRTGNYADHRFTMEKHGATDGGNFYAAKTLLDSKGRRIMWGWITESRPHEEAVAAGWSGVLSLPRLLSVRDDGSLGIAPVPELQKLRGKKQTASLKTCDGESVETIEGVRGQALEIVARFKPRGAKRVGLVLRSTPDRSHAQTVYADLENGILVAGDGAREIAARRVQTAFVPGKDDEIELHVFLDHSVTEVFANGRACLTARSYTQRPDADSVAVYSLGPTDCTLDAWQLAR